MATKKSGKKSKKRLASVDDPTIEAITEGMFRFAAESQAVSLMQRLSEQYAIARDQPVVRAGECPVLKLWIRNFAVTKDDAAKGYKGHFAQISVKQVAEGKYSLVAEKVSAPMQQHPLTERPKRRHPNNGHPVIRAAQRNKIYSVIEDARLALLKMHEEFPETSIPGRDKLHLLLYSRQYKPPIHKVTVRIVAVAEQGYKFELADNVRKDAPPAQAPQTEAIALENQEEKMVDGKYTSLVALQRKKRPIKPKSDKK